MEEVELSVNARRQKETLGYLDPDIYDLLFELEPENWEKLEESHWDRETPVGTFRASYQCPRLDTPDDLFVEVAIKSDRLYLLACKLYWSPQ
jgi:hypothetical protein